MIRQINTTDAPAAIGPYSQAAEYGNLVFLSGQIPLDPRTSEVVQGDIEIQTKQVFANIGKILAAAGCSYSNIIKTTVFLKDMGDFQTMNNVYAGFLSHKPARSAVEVSRLPKNVLVEIEAIAVK